MSNGETKTYDGIMLYPPKPKLATLLMLGQRMRLHLLNCEKHWDTKILKYFDGNTAFNLDYNYQHPREIYANLRNSMYIPYSCIVILINTQCQCGTKILRKILDNIKMNAHLRYKTKLIISGYLLNEYYRSHNDLLVTHLVLRKYAEKNKTSEDIYLHSRVKDLPEEIPQFKNITMADKIPLRDYDIFLKANVENTLFQQIFIKQHMDRAYALDMMLYWLDILPLISINELFQECGFNMDFLIHTIRNVDYYFYSINPALAIIVNNYYFTNNLEFRKGSEQDVKRLLRELKIAQIPFILVQDCSREEILQIVKYIRDKDFSPLQSFYFFLMTHGDADNVVYCQDGQLNFIDDLLHPIEMNTTLRSANKFIIPNMCRGRIDMDFADYNDLKQIQPTDDGFLCENTRILYSVPDRVASPRHQTRGSSFMKIFCNNFRNTAHSQDIRYIHSNINKDLRTINYYCDLENPSDLVIGKGSRPCALIPLRTKAKQMIKLIDYIAQDFPKFQSETTVQNGYAEVGDSEYKTLFYVCGSMKKIEDPQMQLSFIDQYLQPELDSDDCKIDE
ncbi:uncharacterized protein LOC142222251 [Haematobia irritans]|uniref:uncharacterized protein LOC142222251 n=1 Tax=Haematobia irritans TaxID=7368 RepID=UPI003F4F8EDB